MRHRQEGNMADQDQSAAAYNTMTARLLRREALRRAAEELNTTSGPGLEAALARISAEVTAEAAAGLIVPRPPRTPTVRR
jgi:phage shock protein A